MSLGISAIHLASAVRDNGGGRVVTTELSAAKVAAAKKTFAEVGLDDLITVLEGDALATLQKSRRPGGFRAARRMERALRSGSRAARAALVAGNARRRRQHVDGRAGALPRLRARPGERLRQCQLPGTGQRQHGDQLPRRSLEARPGRRRCGRRSRRTASPRAHAGRSPQRRRSPRGPAGAVGPSSPHRRTASAAPSARAVAIASDSRSSGGTTASIHPRCTAVRASTFCAPSMARTRRCPSRSGRSPVPPPGRARRPRPR